MIVYNADRQGEARHLGFETLGRINFDLLFDGTIRFDDVCDRRA